MKTFLLMGQSNAEGRGAGGIWQFSNYLSCWNNQSGRDDALNLGDAFLPPEYGEMPFRVDTNNFMPHACEAIHRELNEPIRFVIVAKGGIPISEWTDGTARGPMYDRLVAVSTAAGVTSYDGFFWHQGESDNGISGAYAAKWSALLGFLETDGFITASTPVVMGTPLPTISSITPVIRSIADADSRIALADIAHLTHLSDNLHFDGPSAYPAGRIYAAGYLSLLEPAP